MKRILTALLALACLLAMAACGNQGGESTESIPDLAKYYEDFMSTLGADNEPAMMDLEGEMIAGYYPGLEGYETNQAVLKVAAITMVPFEFALVELKNESDAEAVAAIFQERIDSQVNGGAFYPMSIEAWQKASVITHGRVVALISADTSQDAAVEAFNNLFA